MNWYPNPTQLLGLNLNGYTNLTLQSHMAQRGLNLPFQLNQFQGMVLGSVHVGFSVSLLHGTFTQLVDESCVIMIR